MPSSTIPIYQLITLDEGVPLKLDEVDFIESSQKPTRQLGRPRKNSKFFAVARDGTPRNANRSPSNMAKSAESLLTEKLKLNKSLLKNSKSGLHAVPMTSKDSNEPLPASSQQQTDSVSKSAGDLHSQSSWEHEVLDSMPIVNRSISFLPESPLALQSHTVNKTEEVVIEQYKSSQSTISDDQSQRSDITDGTASSQIKTLITKATSEDQLKRIYKVSKGVSFFKRRLIY